VTIEKELEQALREANDENEELRAQLARASLWPGAVKLPTCAVTIVSDGGGRLFVLWDKDRMLASDLMLILGSALLNVIAEVRGNGETSEASGA